MVRTCADVGLMFSNEDKLCISVTRHPHSFCNGLFPPVPPIIDFVFTQWEVIEAKPFKDTFGSCQLSSPLCWKFIRRVTVYVLQRHDECADQEPTECTCGPLRDHILPPWAIYPVIKVHNYPRAHMQYKHCLSHQRITSAQGCLLFRNLSLPPVWRGLERFFFLSLKARKIYNIFTHFALFLSLKERPNNVKNGGSGAADDSELNTTPDGQVLQVLLLFPTKPIQCLIFTMTGFHLN